VSKYADQPLNITSGQSPAVGFESDNGVQLTQDMKFYGFGSTFSEPIVAGKDDLVIQYEVKFEEVLNCGGAYIKLPRVSDSFDMSKLDSNTPYTIMFGPDKCGANNKVHFIVQFQNPVTLDWEEKHFNETVPIRNDKKTHLYSLVMRKDNNFEIFIDSVLFKKGNLLTHMIPAINPPKEIDDPSDSKPSDWVDEKEIDDPEATKPDDWDENQPRKIPDPKAVKPAGWLDDAPAKVPDPEAKKPDDWDDDEDGEWEAPLVSNPACQKVGCGVWTPPTIANPAYKGKWKAPKIPNPAYLGPWKAKQIPNPGYFYDPSPIDSLAPMAGLAVEVWTTNPAILFDNFLVSRSTKDATDYAAKTFKLKAAAENAKEKADEASRKEKERKEMVEKGGWKEYITAMFMAAMDFFNDYPAALAGTIAAVVFPFIYILMYGGKNALSPTDEASSTSESAAPTSEEPIAETVPPSTSTAAAATTSTEASTTDAPIS